MTFMESGSLHILSVKLLMRQITAENTINIRQRAGVRRMKKSRLQIDMTPMVDLGFLLISFFVMTAELNKPTAMPLAMPEDQGPPSQLGNSYALTIIPDGKRNFCYEGAWEQAFRDDKIMTVQTEEIRNIIIRKQKILDNTGIYKEGRGGLMMLIKPTTRADYKTLVDVLDEAAICQVKKYAVINLSETEKDWLNKRE
jgi:biopolymer transport protein ExbD